MVPRAVPAMSIAWPLAPERASPWVLSRLWGSQVQPPAWVLQAARGSYPAFCPRTGMAGGQ